MTYNQYRWLSFTLFIFLILLFLAITLRNMINDYTLQQRAVELGFAQYTTDSGKFVFTDKTIEYLFTGDISVRPPKK